MKTLEDLRKDIDNIDKEITKLLDSRFNLSIQIGALKANSSKNVLDTSREQLIYNKIKENDTLTFKDEIKNVYTEIMNNSKKLQRNLKK